jgi:hypothetical protein
MIPKMREDAFFELAPQYFVIDRKRDATIKVNIAPLDPDINTVKDITRHAEIMSTRVVFFFVCNNFIIATVAQIPKNAAY